MKLTKRQVEALVNEFLAKKEKKIKEFTESEEFKNIKLTKEHLKVYNLLEKSEELYQQRKKILNEIKELDSTLRTYDPPSLEEYKRMKAEKKYKSKLVLPRYKEVEDKLILMTLNKDIKAEDILNNLFKIF